MLYYRFLHPKSFEIFQSIRHRGIGGACTERGSTLSLEEKVTPSFNRHVALSGRFPGKIRLVFLQQPASHFDVYLLLLFML